MFAIHKEVNNKKEYAMSELSFAEKLKLKESDDYIDSIDTDKELLDIIESSNIKSDEDWIKEVNESVKAYADELLYDSVIMWCKAVDYDKDMCAPLARGDGQFYRDFEKLGYPHLCLLIKAVKR